MNRYSPTVTLALMLVSSSLPATASAAAPHPAYPVRPVRMIVPYPAGGSGDVIARLLAQRLTATLGQTIIVDNRPGASGLVGTELASKAAPDGYTLLLTTGNNAINVTLHPKLPYDLVRDFEPVALLAPEIPTIAESGFPGIEVIAWFGMAVPAGAPKKIVADLNAAVLAAPATTEFYLSVITKLVSDGVRAKIDSAGKS